MNPNRYRQMGPPAGVCLKPSTVHAPPFRDTAPTILPQEVRQLLARSYAELQRSLDALLGTGQAQVIPAPVLLQDADNVVQVWSGGCRVQVIVSTAKEKS